MSLLNKVLVLAVLSSGFLPVLSQTKMDGPIIICPAGEEYHDHKVLSQLPLQSSNTRMITSSEEIFVIDYIGFSQEAKLAFQRAVDIWESLIKSDVKIRVRAVWEPLGTGVLGAAGASTLFRNFENAPEVNKWYAVSLAEKLAGENLNDSTDYDILASFNSDFENWHLGTEGNPGNRYDLVSVVLHELGHGLGFFSGDAYQNGVGEWDFSGGAPVIYTSLLQNQSGGLRITDLESGTEEVGSFLTSNQVYINSSLVNKANAGASKVYAPSEYDDGSSISHWNENTFNGTSNALMTPIISPGEVLHDPGPVTLSLFADMGWFRTNIEHDPILLADINSPLDIEVIVKSDTSISTDTFSLHYFYPEGDTTTIQLFVDEDGLSKKAIDLSSINSSVSYFFDGLTDGFGRTFRLPESGSFTTQLKTLELRDTPFLVNNGGDFESEAIFNSLSSNSGYLLWSYGTPSGKFNDYNSNAWMTRLSDPIGKPNRFSENVLITPLFDMTDVVADYQISFTYLATFSPYDYFGVSYSLDSGRHWTKLGKAFDGLGEAWYNESSYGDYFSLDTKDETNALSSDTASYPLYEMAGNRVMFKLSYFVLADGVEEEFSNDGVLIDNFQITKNDPSARFVSSDTGLVFPGNEVRFLYASSGATQFKWDFGDGSTSIEKDPKHIYQEGGSYTVTLEVQYQGGQSTFTRENYITVIERKGSTYLLADGGNFEVNQDDFFAINVSGTPFEKGKSTVTGKSGTSSGNNAWVTGIAETEYEDMSTAFLLTPEFDFTIFGNYELRFAAKYSFEDAWDGFIVEYSIDRGKTWKKLNEKVSEGWYDRNSDPDAIFGASVPIFTGNTNNQFEQKHTDVTFLGGEHNVTFRFTFKSDPAVVDAGLVLDDFELIGPELGEVIPSFSIERESGDIGCVNSVYSFVNTSTGSVTDVNWFFGDDASPRVASGSGPHMVTLSESGQFEINLTLIDTQDNITSIDTLISISDTHDPVFTISEETKHPILTASIGDSYQWLLLNDSIQGATEQSFMVERTGSYAVVVKKGDCIQQSELSFIQVIITSVEDNLNLEIFPNPTSGLLNLKYGKHFTSIKLTELSGKQIHEESFAPISQLQLDLKDYSLKPGIYILSVLSNGAGISTFKLVVE